MLQLGWLLVYSLGLSPLAVATPAAPLATAQLTSDPKANLPPKGLVPASVLQIGSETRLSTWALVADKSQRTLTVWQQQDGRVQFQAAFPIDLGKQPGNKETSGDHRTPEGIYFFQEILEGRELSFDEYGSRAFTMDYPNFFDRRKGKTGSGIWLHAIPESKTLTRGSRGCVVVRDSVIREIGKFINLKRTPIVVQDSVTYVFPEELANKRQETMQWIEAWRKSWEEKNLNTYLEFYHPEFRANRMNKSQWGRYKEELNSKYNTIKVSLSPPMMIQNAAEMVVRFIQHYQSDKKEDLGEKNLYLVRAPGELPKIIGETWEAASRELIAQSQ